MNINTFSFALLCALFLSACGLESDNDSNSGNNSSSDTTTDSTVPATDDSVIGDCSLSEQERSLLNAYNDARAEARTCGSRSVAAAPLVKWHCMLGEAAYNHSKDMAEVGFFSHTGSDGSSLSDRIDQTGYDHTNAAENISKQQNVDDVMDTWLNSPPNCLNIMNSALVHMGGGIAESSSSPQDTYWTVKLATPR